MIKADISMLERVAQNLLENALKYTPDREDITVTLSHENDSLVMRMENTGERLTPELLTWLNREGDELTPRPEHTGLGLALVKKILQLHQFQFRAGVTDKTNYFTIAMPIFRING